MAQVTSESEPASPVGKVMAQFTNAVEHIHTATLSIVSVCLLTTCGRDQDGWGQAIITTGQALITTGQAIITRGR